MANHSIMTLSLRIKNLKIDKFDYFLSDIDFTIKTDIFRDVFSLIINQCELRRPKGTSGGHKLSASRPAQACGANLLLRS